MENHKIFRWSYYNSKYMFKVKVGRKDLITDNAIKIARTI